METQASNTTDKELAESRRKCWKCNCDKTAIIEDNAGWRWCFKHYWWQRDGYFSKIKKIIWSNLLK